MAKLAKLIDDKVKTMIGYVTHAYKSNRYDWLVQFFTVWLKDEGNRVYEKEWAALVVDYGKPTEAAYEYLKSAQAETSTFRSDVEDAVEAWLAANTSYDKLIITSINLKHETADLVAYKYNSTSKEEEKYHGLAFDDGTKIVIRLFEKSSTSLQSM